MSIKSRPPGSHPTKPKERAALAPIRISRGQSVTIDDEGAPPTEVPCDWCKGRGHVPKEMNLALQRMSEDTFGTPDPYEDDDENCG